MPSPDQPFTHHSSTLVRSSYSRYLRQPHNSGGTLREATQEYVTSRPPPETENPPPHFPDTPQPISSSSHGISHPQLPIDSRCNWKRTADDLPRLFLQIRILPPTSRGRHVRGKAGRRPSWRVVRAKFSWSVRPVSSHLALEPKAQSSPVGVGGRCYALFVSCNSRQRTAHRCKELFTRADQVPVEGCLRIRFLIVLHLAPRLNVV